MGIGRVSLICTTVDLTLGTLGTLGTPNAKEGHSRQRSLQIVDLGTHLRAMGRWILEASQLNGWPELSIHDPTRWMEYMEFPHWIWDKMRLYIYIYGL